MRIGVISDTHIPDISKNIPETILEDFKKTDMIIHVGDLVDLSVLDILRRSCPNVKAVYGNMDPFEVRKKLPEKEIIKVGNKKIGVTHGYGHPDKLQDIVTEIFKEDDVNLIIFGHSHKDMNEKIGNIIYFNPGSATDTIFASHNSYGIIENNDNIEAKIIKL